MAQSHDAEPGSEQQALGFTADTQPKEEQFNTRFLIAAMKREERRPKIIALGIIAALVLAIVLFAVFHKPSPHPTGFGLPGATAGHPAASPAASPAAPTTPAPH